MSTDPFRLIFKRSQGQGTRPSFILQVSAEMSPEFEQAARSYGYWNELIYADPKLEEARTLKLANSVVKTERKRRRTLDFLSNFDGGFIMVVLFPIWLTFKIMQLVYIVPFKIIWWLFRAFSVQNKQLMRFHELKAGKSISTQSIDEIVEAEAMIKEITGKIETRVLAALNYSGEAFDANATS